MKNIEPENGIDDLLARCVEGTANEDEYNQAWQWAAQSPEHRAHYRNMFDVWMASGMLRPVDPEVQKRVWSKLERKTYQTYRKPGRWIAVLKWTAAVAILVIAYMAGMRAWYESTDEHQYSIQTAKGEKPMLELNDGSKVWLNDETSFIYPKSFNKKSREVRLMGEAYFEIAKYAGKPFIVKTDELKIEVLGTRFNVRASENERFIMTTLVEGSVKIKKNVPAGENDEVILVPGQQLQFDKQNGNMLVRNVNIRLYTAWKERELIFDGDRMEEVFTLIEQNFDVTVMVNNEKLKERRFTGQFSLDERPGKILTLIQQSIPFNFYIQSDTIFVK